MEQTSDSSNRIVEHRVAMDGLAYTKQEFLDYYGVEVGENLWCASEVDRLLDINAKYEYIQAALPWLNAHTTPHTFKTVVFYYWARWTLLAMRMEMVLNAYVEDTDSESHAEHQA